MKKEVDEIEKMVIVAVDYYEKNMSQVEIAKSLGLSRPTVSRLLNEARKERIVKIEVINPYRLNQELAGALCEKLGLTNAVVISGRSSSPEIIRRNIAYAAANYVDKMIQSGEIIGLGWGRTMKDFANYLNPAHSKDVLFVPLLGGVGQVDSSFQTNSITETISAAYQAKMIQFHIPAVIEDRKLKEGLLELPDVKKIVQYWKQMTMAIVGIGVAPLEDQFLFYDYVGELEKLQLSKKGAVGDICLQFFDINGLPMDYINHENISVDLNILKIVKSVIAIAGGKEKVQGIIGASRAKYINCLVTDEYTATAILNRLKN
jgi:DNA-binding transcriptional regulator LsrR (DeoR family)